MKSNAYRTPSLWGVFLLLCIAIFASNCAQIAQPPGGKKDTLAPKLIDSNPKMRAKNVKPKQVELFFNEYINAENLPQKTIITPGSGITFDYRAKPTSVVLIFNEPLKDSTTYTISFTDGIKDASERNVATNLKLVFSTGNQLDSLSLSGTVSNVTTGTTVEGALVGLYAPRDTLDAQRNKPVYYTKTDTSGRFIIENVKAGEYDVLSFTDKNNNFLFNPNGEDIGFLKQRVKLDKSVNGLAIELFDQNTTPIRIQRTDSRSDSYTLNLNKGIESYSVKFRDTKDSLPSTQPAINQIKFFRTKETTDTLSILLTAVDSLGLSNTLRHTINFRQKSKREKPEEFTYRPDPVPNEAVEPNFTWKLLFNKPIGKVNEKRIQFSIDSLSSADLSSFTSTTGKQQTELSTRVMTKARKFIRIKLNKDAFESMLGDTITATTITYPILDPENFGVLRGRITTKEPNYILELIDDRKAVIQRLKNVPVYELKNIKPGKYRLRLIIDTNNNGVWNTGRYEQRVAAEPIVYYPGVILIKQNFESDDINLSY
ncbi:Ig-like domain-containing protein [Fibrella forsythiae]|uniref:Ig-like domain-containing protein n=1 Tax=Fibrella forsythiae TaxID=2817061 RepID=A0ABS3JJM1_9BACT|nr:Ig-like domain-containing protein [Fibrella forsythiae]MBO0950199.1 Ig-like domain-containing protein [Fibrella forsythiae]